MSNYTDLERAILKALVHYDLLDYPLTLVEIHKWLYEPQSAYSLRQVRDAMTAGNLREILAVKHGFYFFSGREALVAKRLTHYALAEKKFRIALKAARWLRWLHLVEFIAVCNKTGYNNAGPESDIDFFIIVNAKRLWFGRLLVTALTTLLGIRRHDEKYIDRICLSFYAGGNHLDLADIRLQPEDPHLAYWLATFAPVYDGGTGRNFFAANGWLTEILPNYYPPQTSHRRLIFENQAVKFFRAAGAGAFGGRLGEGLERLARTLQAKKIKKYFGSLIDAPNTDVVISAAILKFHKNDRRRQYLAQWRDKLNRLGIF